MGGYPPHGEKKRGGGYIMILRKGGGHPRTEEKGRGGVKKEEPIKGKRVLPEGERGKSPWVGGREKKDGFFSSLGKGEVSLRQGKGGGERTV